MLRRTILKAGVSLVALLSSLPSLARIPTGGAAAAGVSHVTSAVLVPSLSGPQDFQFGFFCQESAVPAGTKMVTDADNGQVVIMTTWNDGSAKFCVCSGKKTVTSGTNATVNVSTGTPSGSNMTAANIAGSGLTISIACGASGTFTPALASPTRTFISGPSMVCCLYGGYVGPFFCQAFVRMWLDGNIHVVTEISNGDVDRTTTDQTYAPVVTIGGSVVYSPGTITQDGHTSLFAQGWVGHDPQIIAMPNPQDMMASKCVPTFDASYVQASDFFHFASTYTPLSNGDFPLDMGQTGGSPMIGWQTGWDAAYFTTAAGGATPDVRTVAYTFNDTMMIASYPISWRGFADSGIPSRPSIYPAWTTQGNGTNSGGDIPFTTNGFHWNGGHNPGSWMAFAISGRYEFLDVLAMQLSAHYMTESDSHGHGTSRQYTLETRGRAWAMRDMATYLAMAPSTEPLQADIKALLLSQLNADVAQMNAPGQNALGIVFSYELAANVDGAMGFSYLRSFMQDFYAIVYGMVRNIKPLGASDMLNWNAVEAYVMKWPLGRFSGDGTGTSYDAVDAGTESLVVGPQPSNNASLTNLYANFNSVWTASQLGNGGTTTGNAVSGSNVITGLASTSFVFNGMAVGDADNLVPGGSYVINAAFGAGQVQISANMTGNATGENFTFSAPSGDLAVGLATGGNTARSDTPTDPQGYWSLLQAALCLAVDHGLPGASAALTKLKGFTNYNAIRFATAGGTLGGSDPEFKFAPRTASL